MGRHLCGQEFTLSSCLPLIVMCWRRNKANDLKEQLTWWARPPEADWPTREQRLEWLEHALGEAQDIMRAMQTNGALDADISTYVDIVRVSLS